jgi:Flp pilus assembly protein TadG
MLRYVVWGRMGLGPGEVSYAMKRRSTAWWRQLVAVIRLRLPLREQRGQAMVEFALVSAPLFIILFGVMQFGMAWNRENDAVHLANEAVRKAAVATTFADICSKVADQLNANGIGSTHNNIPNSVNLAIALVAPDTGTAGPSAGDTVSASLTGVPLVNLLGGLVPTAVFPANVSGTAYMRAEQAFSASVNSRSVRLC